MNYLFVTLIFHILFADSSCEPLSTSSPTSDIVVSQGKLVKVACETHANCSSRILTLDTYCCPTNHYCCNWFEFASKYKSDPSLPLKAPSILTILAILLLIICFLFVSYCFSILFCFCLKCGIFKRPKVIILSSSSHINNSSSNTESHLFSTSENGSPKHSTSSATSSQSSSSSNRRRQHHNLKSAKHKSHSSSSRLTAHNSKKNRRSSSSNRSPTARVYSNSSRHHRSTHNSQQRNYTDTENYIELDANNESPFLIPPELSEQVQSRVNRSLNQSGNRSSVSSFRNFNSVITSNQASAPLASADLIVDESRYRPITSSVLDPVTASSLTSSTTSSLGFGESLMEAIAASTQHTNDLRLTSTQNVKTVQTNYYHDEKPPSYDDIIRRNY